MKKIPRKKFYKKSAFSVHRIFYTPTFDDLCLSCNIPLDFLELSPKCKYEVFDVSLLRKLLAKEICKKDFNKNGKK